MELSIFVIRICTGRLGRVSTIPSRKRHFWLDSILQWGRNSAPQAVSFTTGTRFDDLAGIIKHCTKPDTCPSCSSVRVVFVVLESFVTFASIAMHTRWIDKGLSNRLSFGSRWFYIRVGSERRGIITSEAAEYSWRICQGTVSRIKGPLVHLVLGLTQIRTVRPPWW